MFVFRSKTEHVVPIFDNDINSEYYASTTAKPQAKSPIFTSNDYYYNMNPTSSPSGPRNSNNYSQSYNILRQPKMPVNQPHFQLSTIRTNSASRNNPTEFPEFDGTYNVANGFQYYLKRQYHEEEQDSTGTNVGSFGYIDPFGIRRVIYYKTDPRTGSFHHKKNNKYVGFASTPYDPSLPNLYRSDD